MSIFGKIKDAIFGSAKAKEAAPAGSAAPASPGAAAGASPPKPTAPAAPPASAPISQVDVEAVLTKRAAQNEQKLDWRQVDRRPDEAARSRQQPRRAQGARQGAGLHRRHGRPRPMNIWLHKQVMNKLAASGGKVPDDLKT